MNGFRQGLRWKRILGVTLGAGGVALGGVIVAQCAAGPTPPHKAWNPSLPGNIPDLGFRSWDYNWDLRDPRMIRRAASDKESEEGKKKPKKPKAVRHLVLIRHGQYNLEGDTDEKRYLTDLGKEQAKALGKRLKELNIKWTSLVSSNMTRAIETATIMKDVLGQVGLEIEEKDPLLREGAPALPEPPVGHWHPDLSQYYEDGARIESGFRKYFHRADPSQENDSYELIVCHANVIRYFTCRALQFPGEAWLRISLCHTSLTVISILPSGRVILRTLGDGGHLPCSQVTTS